MKNLLKNQWGKIYAAAKQLHEAGYEPTDIPVIAENLVKTYGVGALTPQGIVNNVICQRCKNCNK